MVTDAENRILKNGKTEWSRGVHKKGCPARTYKIIGIVAKLEWAKCQECNRLFCRPL